MEVHSKPCFQVVRLIAINRPGRFSKSDQHHRPDQSDQKPGRPISRPLIAISRSTRAFLDQGRTWALGYLLGYQFGPLGLQLARDTRLGERGGRIQPGTPNSSRQKRVSPFSRRLRPRLPGSVLSNGGQRPLSLPAPPPPLDPLLSSVPHSTRLLCISPGAVQLQRHLPAPRQGTAEAAGSCCSPFILAPSPF